MSLYEKRKASLKDKYTKQETTEKDKVKDKVKGKK